MRTRYQRSISQARSVLDSCVQSQLSQAERDAIDRESEAAVAAERRRLEDAHRLITHPVIEPIHGWRFRVMRRYRDRDHGDLFECIGEARSQVAAEAIARKEQGSAYVFEVGKQRFWNFQPTEVRA